MKSDLYIEIFIFKNLDKKVGKVEFAHKLYEKYIKDSNLFSNKIKDDLAKKLFNNRNILRDIDDDFFKEIEMELIK